MKHILVLILTLAFAPARADEPLPLFDLQSQSGQLWTAIKAHLDAKDAKIATLTAERDAHAQTIADFLAADDAGAAKLRGNARKSEKQKQRDAAQAEFDAAKAKLEAAKAALNAAGN
jgi:hypothetical protein